MTTVAQKFSWTKVKQSLILCGIFYYTLAALAWSYPSDNHWLLGFNRANESWLLWSGLWQRWEMYYLSPGSRTVFRIEANVGDDLPWTVVMQASGGIAFRQQYFSRRHEIDPRFIREFKDASNFVQLDFCDFSKRVFQLQFPSVASSDFQFQFGRVTISRELSHKRREYNEIGECFTPVEKWRY